MLHLFWRGIWNNNFVKDTISCQRILFQRIVFRRYCICILFVCLFVCLFICVVVDCVFNHNNCIVPLSISGELLHGEGRGWTEKSHCGAESKCSTAVARLSPSVKLELVANQINILRQLCTQRTGMVIGLIDWQHLHVKMTVTVYLRFVFKWEGASFSCYQQK